MSKIIMALDIGEKRTGVAIVNTEVSIPRTLTTLTEPGKLEMEVAKLVKEHNADVLVIGLPRSLGGDKTDQTRYVEIQAAKLTKSIDRPMYFVDEAVTSLKAEQELKSRNKPYAKEEVDMLAAVYLLEDFLRDHPKGETGA